MSYLFIIIMLIFLLIVFFHIFKKDILAPTVISIFSFIICVFCAFLGLLSWNNQLKLNDLIFLILFIGLISFGIGECFARMLHKKKENRKYEHRPIYIEEWKISLMIIIILMTILCMYLDIKRICALFGLSTNNIPTMLAFYRNKSALFSTELITSGQGISFVTNQLLKVSNIFCIICIFCLLNNLILGEKLSKNKGYIISIILSCFLSLFTSGRGLLMRYIACAFIMWTILYRNFNIEKNRDKIAQLRHITFKILKTGFKFFVIAIIIFYLVIPLVGRNKNIEFLNYISFYFGASVPSLNIFLNSFSGHTTVFGGETLMGIYSVLNKLGITHFVQFASREFINFGNLSSNIYTGFRRYYYDFGLLGIIICQFIFGFVFTKIYLKASQKGNIKWLIFYGYMSSILIDQIRDEAFFVTFISSSTIAYIIFIYIIYFFCFKLKVKFR